MMKGKLTQLLAFTLVLVGCNSDPIPEGGTVQRTEPQVARPVDSPLTLNRAQMEFFEGREEEYNLEVNNVPSGRRAILEFEGLPDGVKYDAETNTMSWTPDHGTAFDSSDPFRDRKTFRVTVFIGIEGDDITRVSRPLELMVRHTPRNYSLLVNQGEDVVIKEGVEAKVPIRVINDDFDQQFHFVLLDQIIPGLLIMPDENDPMLFHMVYKPALDTIRLGERGCTTLRNCSVTHQIELTVVAPNGLAEKERINVKIENNRVPPQVELPIAPKANGAGVFRITARDPNMEEAPVIKLKNSPRRGVIREIKVEDNVDEYTTAVDIEWSRIPKGMNEGQFDFEICQVTQFATNWREAEYDCSLKKQVVVKNSDSSVFAAPEVDRSEWESQERKFVRESEAMEVAFSIEPASGDEIINVLVAPAELASEVYWKDDKLFLTGRSVGQKEARLVIQTRMGADLEETLAYEVLPENWSDIMLVSAVDRPANDLFGSEERRIELGINVVNPSVHGPIPARELAYKTKIIILDNALSALQGQEEFYLQMFEQSPDILVIGRLVANLEGPLLDALNSMGLKTLGLPSNTLGSFNAHGTYFVNLISEQGTMLEQYPVAHLSGNYGVSTGAVREVSIMGFAPGSSCRVRANLVDDGGVASYATAAVCKRDEQSNIAIVGFGTDDVRIEDMSQFNAWLLGLLE